MVLCVVAVCWAAFYSMPENSSLEYVGIEEDLESATVVPIATYPTDRLFITESREAYVDSTLRLVVPRMGVDCMIVDGVDYETLKRGPGLYDYAQLPGYGNPNVSIAGHRDIYGAHFMQIHTLTEGDYLYLVYEGKVYQYRFLECWIVEPDDWSPIYCRNFSCITLTSCDPIYTSLRRIIATGELVNSQEYTEDYVFALNEDPAVTMESSSQSQEETPESAGALPESGASEDTSHTPGLISPPQ